MSIPILNELSAEVLRIYVAGSPLAKGDPRLKKFAAPLAALGERAPVFAALAARVEALAAESGGEPEQLLELGMLLFSVLNTQVEPAPEGELAPHQYPDVALTSPEMPHSELSGLLDCLSAGAGGRMQTLADAVDSGRHRDPRLYAAYCDAITDNRTAISCYVEDVIIPSVGRALEPFLRAALDISGGKRDARLFQALYALVGAEILPLSEEIIASGSPPLVTQAVYTLCEDARHEEALLAYTRDRKGEVRQAAFTALARMDSEKGELLIAEALAKPAIKHLCEAMRATRSLPLIALLYEQLQLELTDMKDRAQKIKDILQIIAARDEAEGLRLLETLLGNRRFFDAALGLLELREVADILCEADTPEKNRLLYNISKGNVALAHYHVRVCVRLLEPGAVYKECRDGMKISGLHLHNSLIDAYGIDRARVHALPDSVRRWDARWAELFIGMGELHTAYILIHHGDTRGWSQLLDACAASAKKSVHKPAHLVHMLRTAFDLRLPFAGKYYDKFIKAGYPPEVLDAAIPR